MNKIINIGKILIVTLFVALSTGIIYSSKPIVKPGVAEVECEYYNDRIRVNSVENLSKHEMTLIVDEDTIGTIGTIRPLNVGRYAYKKVSVKFNEGNNERNVRLWRKGDRIPGTGVAETSTPKEPETKPEPEVVKDREHLVTEPEREAVVIEEHIIDAAGDDGSTSVLDQLNFDSFFGEIPVRAFVEKANRFTNDLSKAKDKEQFIADNNIESFISESETEIALKKDEIPTKAADIVRATNINESSREKILNYVIELMNSRLKQREEALTKLKDAVKSSSTDEGGDSSVAESIINYVIIGLTVVVLAWLVIVVARKKKSKSKTSRQAAQVQQNTDTDPNNPAIVVRRKTTSILKTQSIDDVVDNPQYLLISSSEFTPDSAVRYIYIKNTCIKDVYNMYAEDLRNTENPKEDGCMVLGRWVYDEDSRTYDISLETVVYPGDDAVFKEYELNFGGKIKLRIAEKLRKLRRETNLQYDLVCWIHSHPGLGVFFSNSDDTVQMQLKHSQHPNFLIAFVIDILTTTQEMGIFTFRKDGTMNSKGDITKMYSLEDLYKWALESEKVTFTPENYFNILDAAKVRLPLCKGIELNNSSIIDITQILIDPIPGVVGWVVGTSLDVDGNKEYVVSSVVKTNEKPTTGIIGALLNVTHMSLPTIQRLIANESAKLSFVIVYSSRMNTVTSIPIINGEIITDENLYGEETIEDLKIWTRRKR